MTEFKAIDGSLMEGGGQILRMSVGFSALLRKPIRIANIRGLRSKPGLKAQHLNGLFLVRDISGSVLDNAVMNSTEIDFTPGRALSGGEYAADTKTAGATTLLAQVSLPCLLFADAKTMLDLRGGTDAQMAPSANYYAKVFRPNLNKFGADFDCQILKKGYYPRGGGRVVLTVDPVHCLQPVTMTVMGDIVSVCITSSVSGTLPIRVSQEMAAAAKKCLAKGGFKTEINVESYQEPSATGNGSSILIVAQTSTGCILGGSAIGTPKEKPSATGESAARELLDSLEFGACVDGHMQDQLIILMALAKGTSKVRMGPLSLHTETAIHVSREMSGATFNVEQAGGSAVIVVCDGIGFENGGIQR
jgi:RNA 3'-terminal phosphate cyclase (ATP)